ncbi:glycosyltransferase family 2 protein [Mesorhizobium sp. BAC0120]|uniref:glycosyltransferase family 2 protein n=1 Tax=Mesorhizobium sp. BAC0120 TaxID=3090670 RepID=UPI00298C4CE0|nr:glycosyltransferase family 2 protein [Mesorhizobium sp. BAC0120]MDW6025922.1 glycosyltransferase family 2 protein [Mesorhizobium sp. BAC0120]
MNISSKIFAIIVTFNRKDLLHECLTKVSAQTRTCDKIVVIDNESTDGTFEMLTQDWRDCVEIHSLPKNVGAAGGFNIGMRIAYQGGADFLWVMDDDVIPEADALECLLAANDVLRDQGRSVPFLMSVARSPNGMVTNVPTIDKRHNQQAYENWPALLEHKMVPVRRATFASILLPRDTLQTHGLPIASMFIWGEDTEYTLRVTTEHSGYLVGDSKVVHVRQLNGMIDIKKEQNAYRVSYFLHYFRNRLYTFRKYSGRRAAIDFTIRLLPLMLALCASRQFAKARIVLSGILTGWLYDPTIEQADAVFDDTGIRSFPSLSAARSGAAPPVLE